MRRDAVLARLQQASTSGTVATFDLSGKVAIVTGSGRGLGKVMVRGLAIGGAKVTVAARTGSGVLATATERADAVAGHVGSRRYCIHARQEHPALLR